MLRRNLLAGASALALTAALPTFAVAKSGAELPEPEPDWVVLAQRAFEITSEYLFTLAEMTTTFGVYLVNMDNFEELRATVMLRLALHDELQQMTVRNIVTIGDALKARFGATNITAQIDWLNLSHFDSVLSVREQMIEGRRDLAHAARMIERFGC